MLKIARIAIKKNAAFSDCIVVFGVKPYIVALNNLQEKENRSIPLYHQRHGTIIYFLPPNQPTIPTGKGALQSA